MNEWKNRMAVSREIQLDAIELDSECYKLFREHLQQTIPHLSKLLEKIEPEISALIGLAVYVLPLYTSSGLVGQQLLGIRFSGAKPKHQHYSYGLLVVLIQWLTERWHSIHKLLFHETSQRIVCAGQYFQIASKILSLANSIAFLVHGSYPTVYHRALRLQTELIDPNQPKTADLSTLTRELIWHSFAETLMFALPLINVHRLRRWVAKISTFKNDKNEQSTETSFLDKKCAVCNDVPILATNSKCRHVFCYYCLEANLAATPDFTCPLCSSPIEKE